MNTIMTQQSWRTRYACIRDIVYLEYDLSDESDLPTADEATLDEAIAIARDLEDYYVCMDTDGDVDGYDPDNRRIIKDFIRDYGLSE